MIEALVDWLNANAGVIAALAAVVAAAATAAYAVLTLRIIHEARADRLEAALVGWAAMWDLAPDYLIVSLQNHGRATASSVLFERSLVDGSGKVRDKRTHRQAILPVGVPQRFLPQVDNKRVPAADMIVEGMRLELRWSWQDGRRDRRGRPVTSTGRLVETVADVVDGYKGGAALLEPEVPREIKKIREAVEVIAEGAKRRTAGR